jgi:hypothetical protein
VDARSRRRAFTRGKPRRARTIPRDDCCLSRLPYTEDRRADDALDLTAWAGPWGNSYAANLTPDRETGIGGRYTEAAFIKTIRTGVKPEGEQLAPPMPWPVYRNMTDEDLKSMYAYLTTLPAVKNIVRAAPSVAPKSTR